MATPEQKEIWRKEKEQLLQDKAKAGKEIRRRPVELKLEGQSNRAKSTGADLPPELPDKLLRQRLGI